MNKNSKEFKELQKKWYAKLKDKGFEDAEDSENRLRVYHTYEAFKQHNRHRVITEAKESYYRMAEHFLHSYKFPSAVHKFIWKLHSEGVSIRDIAKIAAKKYNNDASDWKVFMVINETAEIMKEQNRSQANDSTEE